jgi:transcription elongation factor GreB
MSNALVTELPSDEADDEESLSPTLQIPPGSKNYMTPAGHAKMREEFEHLVKVERPQMVEVVAWAASNGDRSENGDYIYGKRRLREIDRRIRFLSKRLDNAEVVDPVRQQGNDRIFFGATITVSYDGEDDQVYSIVGIDEADVSRGRISWVSPLARTLIKSREGDLVRLQTPAGVREIQILEVQYVSLPE